MSIFKFALYLGLLPLLTACSTTEGQFPSLERRPYETESPVSAPAASSAPVALPAMLAAKVDMLNARYKASRATFANDLVAIRSVASKAAGSPPGSEGWVNAHLQLSRLDKARADSVAVVREFDALIAAQAESDTNFIPLLTDAQKPVAAAVAAQNAEIEQLSKLIGE